MDRKTRGSGGEGLEGEAPLEDEVGGTGEGNLGVGVGGFDETDFEGISPFDKDLDGGRGVSLFVKEESGGDHPRPAGEGFVFDAAFVGADGDGGGGEDGGEVRVGAFGGEVGVMAEGVTEFADWGGGEVIDKDDRVGDAGIDGVNGEGKVGDLEWGIEGEGVGEAHVNLDEIADAMADDFAREGFEVNRARLGADFLGETGEAAGPISAHFGFTAVGVVVAHAEVGGGLGGFDSDEAIGADAAMAVTNLGDLGGGEWEYIEAIIDHDEVIACAVHFGEIQHMEERKAGMRAGRYEVFFKGESGMWK